MKRESVILSVFFFVISCVLFSCNPSYSPEMIILNGKIVTVDQDFTIAEAVAIEKGKIVAVGSTNRIRKLSGNQTKIVDLKGSTVIPGINDAHLHPETASLSELNEEIPDLHTIDELLEWIKEQTKIKKPDEWIIFPKMFFTRLIELRQPSLAELDQVAPHHPVFLNGSYGGMINSAAMRISDITKKTNHPGIIRDEKTGLPTGLIRASAFGMLKMPAEKEISWQERLDALESMLKRYNHYGITSLCSGSDEQNSLAMYKDLHKSNKLTVRIFQNILLSKDSERTVNNLIDTIRTFSFKTGTGDEWVRIGALKIILDGGILTGTAYLREPWGNKAQNIFGIEDTTYRGVLNYSREEILKIVTVANELDWKFTAHCTGGGGVDILLDVFEEVNRLKPVKERRFSIIHGNFFTEDAIRRMKQLGIYADMQPAWFYKDADAMQFILGENRIRSFHPYRSLLEAGVIVNGGSDHMVKWDANTSVNPYNPFLAMWTMITRITERGSVILPEEAITREQALKLYTINNALASFEESIKGSIEPGKLADMAVLSDDILTCPVDQIKDIESELTIVGGRIVYSSGKLASIQK
jgi:predicted amidohydrolase YtcJ